MADMTELERLRARVAELEARLGDEGSHSTGTERGSGRSRWLGTASAALLVLACLLSPLSVSSVWASTQLSDSEQYVETVAPLAEDPAVQAAIADEVTLVLLDGLDIDGVTEELLDTLAAQPNVPPRVAAALPALRAPLVDGVESFTRTQVENFLASPQFAQVWAEVNRVAHEQVVRLLEGGDQAGVLTAEDDAITINLGPIIDEVKNRLVDQGFDLAANVPSVDRSFVLVQSDALTDAQSFYRLLNQLGTWLPFIVLGLFFGGVLLAQDRRRALLKGALGVAAAMLLLGVVLTLFRVMYVETTPADILTEQGAGNVFDTLVRFLRTGLRAVGVLGLILAVAALLTGPSSTAVRARRAISGGIGALRGGAEAAGWNAGRLGTWTYANKGVVRVAILVIAALTLMFWSRPTAWVVVVTAVLVLAALAVVEFIGRQPGAQPAITATAGPAGHDEESSVPTQPGRRDSGEATSPSSAGGGDEQVPPQPPVRAGSS